jgi:hypothetical protein
MKVILFSSITKQMKTLSTQTSTKRFKSWQLIILFLGCFSLGNLSNAFAGEREKVINHMKNSPAWRDPLTEVQSQKIFPEMKKLTLVQINSRVQSIEKEKDCLNLSKTVDDIKICKFQTRLDANKIRNNYKSKINKIYDENGIKIKKNHHHDKKNKKN